uniref:LAM_G_DOMAIN domain-containing protein n=1 Tax=Macrostomum lignano TaxID=282301 RepID=A0A1I8FA68_9PLAT
SPTPGSSAGRCRQCPNWPATSGRQATGPTKPGWTLGLDRTVPHPPMIDTKKVRRVTLCTCRQRDETRIEQEDSAGEPVRALVLPFESADGAWVPHPGPARRRLPAQRLPLRLLPASFGRASACPAGRTVADPLAAAWPPIGPVWPALPAAAAASPCAPGCARSPCLAPARRSSRRPTFRLRRPTAVRFVDADTGEVWLASGGAAVSLNSWHLVEFAWQRGLGASPMAQRLAGCRGCGRKKIVRQGWRRARPVLHVGGDPPAEGGAGGSSWPAFDLERAAALTAAKLLGAPLRRCGVDGRGRGRQLPAEVGEGFSVDLLLPASRGGVETASAVHGAASRALSISGALRFPASGLTSGRPANLTVSWQREAGLFVYLDNSLATAAYLARTLAEQPTANRWLGQSVARARSGVSLAWWNAKVFARAQSGAIRQLRCQGRQVESQGSSFTGSVSESGARLLRQGSVCADRADGLLHIEYKYIQDIGVDARHVMSGLITMRPEVTSWHWTGRMHLLSRQEVDGPAAGQLLAGADRGGNVNLARHPTTPSRPAFSGEVGGAVVQAGGRSIDLLAELGPRRPRRASVPFSMTGSVSVVYEPPPTSAADAAAAARPTPQKPGGRPE